MFRELLLVTHSDGLHAQTLELRLCWGSCRQVGCYLGVLDLGQSLGLCSWAFGLMAPEMDLGAACQGIVWASPLLLHL